MSDNSGDEIWCAFVVGEPMTCRTGQPPRIIASPTSEDMGHPAKHIDRSCTSDWVRAFLTTARSGTLFPMSHNSGNEVRPAFTNGPLTFQLKNGRACVMPQMTEDDAEELCALLPKMHSESDFLNYLPGEFGKTVEEEKEYIREHTTTPGSLAVVVKVDGRIVAVGGARSPEFKRMAHHAELGLVVLKEFWGLGIGRKIMETIIEWGRRRRLRKMYLKVYADNDRAINLYRSLGFVEEGHLRQDVRRGDGTYGDALIMAKYFPSWISAG